jgi:hypothetical protein
MSSIAGAYSQVAPFKRYLATATFQLYNSAGALSGPTITVSAGPLVLKDMGKTKIATATSGGAAAVGSVLRKVALLPTPAGNGPVVVGYIVLSDTVPSQQEVVALN